VGGLFPLAHLRAQFPQVLASAHIISNNQTQPMKSFAGEKIKATPVKTLRGLVRHGQKCLARVSLPAGSPGDELAKQLYQSLEESMELAKQLQRYAQ
jgi:hypothetical protein